MVKNESAPNEIQFINYKCMKNKPYPETSMVNGYGFRIFIFKNKYL